MTFGGGFLVAVVFCLTCYWLFLRRERVVILEVHDCDPTSPIVYVAGIGIVKDKDVRREDGYSQVRIAWRE